MALPRTAERPISQVPAQSSVQKEHKRPLDSIIVTTVLFAASVVYLVFVAVQFRYLFMGLPNEMTYAEYCRRGFGELVFVIVLTTAVIAAVCMLTTRNARNRLPGYTKAALLLISACDCVMIVSAARRVVIYVEAYGMTVARLNAAVLIFLMAAGVLIAALKILFEDLKVSVMAGCVLIAVMTAYACVNVDGVVAGYNVNRYLKDPAHNKIDLYYLSELSAGAMPALDRLMDETSDASMIRNVRYTMALIADDHALFVGDADRIARWSWDRQKAVDILDKRGVNGNTLNSYYDSDFYRNRYGFDD